MNRDQDLTQAKHIGAGLSFIVFPAVRVFAFAVHPDLLHPQLLGPEELIRRAHGNDLLQFAHVLVMLNTALMVVIAVRFMRRLEHTRFTRAGLVGASLAGQLANAAASASAEAATTTLTARRDQTPDPGVVHEREPAASRTPEA